MGYCVAILWGILCSSCDLSRCQFLRVWDADVMLSITSLWGRWNAETLCLYLPGRRVTWLKCSYYILKGGYIRMNASHINSF